MLLLILIIPSFSQTLPNSLYSDNVVSDTNLSQQQLDDQYHYSSDLTTTNLTISSYLTLYVETVFDLTQLLPKLELVIEESSVYSHISRLEYIANSLQSQIDDFTDTSITYQPKDKLTKLQHFFQNVTYRLNVFTPYMPQLLYTNYEDNTYLINYMSEIYVNLKQDLESLSSYQQQLNVSGMNSSLPFTPKSPLELSFALENQITQSMMGMFGPQPSSIGTSSMPYSSISTPENTDLFNMGNLQQQIPSVGSSNVQMFQMMNSFPSF